MLKPNHSTQLYNVEPSGSRALAEVVPLAVADVGFHPDWRRHASGTYPGTSMVIIIVVVIVIVIIVVIVGIGSVAVGRIRIVIVRIIRVSISVPVGIIVVSGPIAEAERESVP